MRPVVFSASSLNSYLTCHLQWFFTYVLQAEGATSEARDTGVAIHEYAEKRLNWTRFEENRNSAAEATMRMADRADLPTPLFPLADVFDRDILPTYRDPVLVEAAFQLEINDVPFSGVIDSLDRQDYGADAHVIILRDLKTTAARPSPGKYRLNLIGYYLGARDLGYEPKIMQLDYIVRTKKPYYWPEPVFVPDDDEIDEFAATLTHAADMVGAGNYQPTGLGTWACNYCPHAADCGPYQRHQENPNA